MNHRQELILSGCTGLLAAILVGAGEFMLHFDELARYVGGFEFFRGVGTERATIGHFFGVLGAPLYVYGAWHIKLMLQPASRLWSTIAFVAMAYGMMVGAVWIGSRATAAYLVNTLGPDAIGSAWALYGLRYESLLTVTRVAILALSIIFIALILTGRSRYPRWVVIVNPIIMILVSFAIFWLLPSVGKYLMPIALNVAFFVLFAISTALVLSGSKHGEPK